MCCCSNCDDENSPSECQCSPCRYRNGCWPLLVAQLLVITAFVFSLSATKGCHFVTVEASLVANTLDQYQEGDFFVAPSVYNSNTRGLGFYLWESYDGTCTAEDTDLFYEAYKLYIDFLGSDWKAPRVMAILSTILAFFLMIWLFVFSCVAHPKWLRFTLAIFFIVLMPIFQSIPFMLLNSDFCKEYSCSLGRSAKYAAGATSLYALIGVAFLFTITYPKAPAEPKTVATLDLEQQKPAKNDDVVQEVPADVMLQKLSPKDESPEMSRPVSITT